MGRTGMVWICGSAAGEDVDAGEKGGSLEQWAEKTTE